jgi:hypothetical protein
MNDNDPVAVFLFTIAALELWGLLVWFRRKLRP